MSESLDDSILVTGGAGYVGSHFGLALAERGAKYAVLDNFERGHREFVRGAEILEADIRDPASLRRALAGRRFGTIVHFAAYAYVGEANERPADYAENNIGGTLNVVRAGIEHGVRRIIFSSSCATYGDPLSPAIDEDHAQNPVSHYGWTKLMAERVLQQFHRQYGLGVGILRYFNAAGADPAGRLGERHDPETHLVPLAIDAALGTRPELCIYGADYPTPDGTCIRDYVHVSDLADAHLKLVDALQPGEWRTYNLGSGAGTSIRELLHRLEPLTGRAAPHRFVARRVGDPPALVAASGKARRELGWEPKHDMDSILRTAIAWHRQEAARLEKR